MWNSLSKEAFDRIFRQQLMHMLSMDQDDGVHSQPRSNDTDAGVATPENANANTAITRQIITNDPGSETDLFQPAQYESNDLPICSVCDSVSLECLPLPSCPHPACPKCLDAACQSTADVTATSCKICLKEELELASKALSENSSKIAGYSEQNSKHSFESGIEATSATLFMLEAPHSGPASSSQMESNTTGPREQEVTTSSFDSISSNKKEKQEPTKKPWVSFSSNDSGPHFSPADETEGLSRQHAKKELRIDIVPLEKDQRPQESSEKSKSESGAAGKDHSLQVAGTYSQDNKPTDPLMMGDMRSFDEDITRHARDSKVSETEKNASLTLGQKAERKPSISKVSAMDLIKNSTISSNADTQKKQNLSDTEQKEASLKEWKDNSLAENIKKIQRAFAEATKYSHCYECLRAKKSVAPDVLCLDCALSFCNRCCSKHRSTGGHAEHIIVPVVESRNNKTPHLGPGFCLNHKDVELTQYCRNCEELICRDCIADQHLDCPGVVSATEFATEEREAVKRYRVKYAQVMRFFSEQRRDSEETMVALNMKKKAVLADIRKFFSALIKACMDIEGSLLEELETAVCDQTDLLKEQSSTWQDLQESMKQLLDFTDILHFLPSGDFLPLSAASKVSLSQALRQGEELAAAAPPQMMLSLCLEQSSQRSVIKRIKEIGATALTVTTHNTLSLRKINDMSFCDTSDKDEPLVTSLILLTHCVLLAADFNNACLKLLHKDQQSEDWNIAQVLPLKFRPYGLAPLSGKSGAYSATVKEKETLEAAETQCSRPSGGQNQKCEGVSSSCYVPPASDLQENHQDTHEDRTTRRSVTQTAVSMDDEEVTSLTKDGVDFVVQVAVSSPFTGCIIVSVPGTGRMSIAQTICKEKGCWGIATLDQHTLAVCGVDAGRTYINLIDTRTAQKQKLNISSETLLTPLVSPRHLQATSPTTLIVCDHGRKAAVHIDVSGKILFTYQGHGNQRLSRPEGLCMDSQGFIYIADSGDHSISIIAKGGHLLSKTGSQQNDLQCPQAVCVDRNSCLYVSNNSGKTLSIFDIIQDS